MTLFLYLGIILLGIGIDQLTKYLCVARLGLDCGSDVPVIPEVFHLRCISNDGAAFGILDDHRWIFMTVSTLALCAMIAYLIVRRKKTPMLLGVALSLVISGGIGNMIDRVRLGYVVDFIYFKPIDFPCFNAADSFVCIGAALIFLWAIFFDSEGKKGGKTPPDTTASDGQPDGGATEGKENDEN